MAIRQRCPIMLIALSNVTALGGEDVNRPDQYGYATIRAFHFDAGKTGRLYRSAIATLMLAVVALAPTSLIRSMPRSNTRTEIVEHGFYPDWSRAADTEIGIQTGPFPITSSLAADVGYTVEYGSGEPIR